VELTAFDTAWRKGKEDATARTLQEAYDQGGDDFNRFQRWFHVAEPIEVLMPNSDKPKPMERTHIGTNRLADEKGEYVGAEQAMADYQEDLQNLSRKRKNPKDPKHARIFIPNPESKKDDIGDFHIDEAHSDDWQEKLAGEPMTAFDTAWSLLKMPVVPNTLHEIDPRTTRSGTPDKSYKALFQDPITNVIEPLYVDYIKQKNMFGDDLFGYDGQIGEEITRQGKLYDHDDRRKSISTVGWAGKWNHGNKAYPGWTETRRELRGRGYAPSLYDVMAFLMNKNNKTPLSPSTEQSGSAKVMWKNRDRWPVRDDL
jgi:hypothetical protein